MRSLLGGYVWNTEYMRRKEASVCMRSLSSSKFLGPFSLREWYGLVIRGAFTCTEVCTFLSGKMDSIKAEKMEFIIGRVLDGFQRLSDLSFFDPWLEKKERVESTTLLE